ncbi:ABC transporter permease [Bosea sp. 2YAB26]|uniref:ABC transporter permease n=1 Tax=unclassified Bosea (in: a-proteobacteria) TaxID=2653178 RepID=UPI003F8EEC54
MRLPRWAAPALRGGLSVALTLLGLLALTFFIGRVLPFDPIAAVVGEKADASVYENVRIKLGLDQPLYIQFVMFLRDMLSGNFGRAIFTGNPVADDLRHVIPATVELATVAIVIGSGLGIPFGVAAAVYRGKPIDHAVRLLSLIGHSVPIFWLGLMGLIVFYAWLGWVGGSGRVDIFYLDAVPKRTGLLLVDSALAGDWDVFVSAARHIILPALLLGYSSMAYISRMTRSFMLDQLSQEYITTARVKGLSRRRVVWGHAFRNVLVQLATVIAISYGGLLEGAVLTETVFAWPGFGQYLTTALMIGDMNAVLACTLIVGLVFICLNLITDLLYRFLDPRTR